MKCLQLTVNKIFHARHREECKEQVDGVVARFKKFETYAEAQAFMEIKDPRDNKSKRVFVRFIKLAVNLS